MRKGCLGPSVAGLDVPLRSQACSRLGTALRCAPAASTGRQTRIYPPAQHCACPAAHPCRRPHPTPQLLIGDQQSAAESATVTTHLAFVGGQGGASLLSQRLSHLQLPLEGLHGGDGPAARGAGAGQGGDAVWIARVDLLHHPRVLRQRLAALRGGGGQWTAQGARRGGRGRWVQCVVLAFALCVQQPSSQGRLAQQRQGRQSAPAFAGRGRVVLVWRCNNGQRHSGHPALKDGAAPCGALPRGTVAVIACTYTKLVGPACHATVCLATLPAACAQHPPRPLHMPHMFHTRHELPPGPLFRPRPATR